MVIKSGSYFVDLLFHHIFLGDTHAGTLCIKKLKDLKPVPLIECHVPKLLIISIPWSMLIRPFYRCSAHLINQLEKFPRKKLKQEMVFN